MAASFQQPLVKRVLAEWTGTALLLIAVVGSGIMGDRLSGGNAAIALLANSAATGATLFVFILSLGPISGAHFNPVVSLVAGLQRKLKAGEVIAYGLAQVAGAVAGVWIAHLMFDERIFQVSQHARTGWGQWTGEFVATFGLLLVIQRVAKTRPEAVAGAVAAYITGAYWFTSSTSFANPAVTLARTLTDTFAGIRPVDAPGFIVAQVLGMIAALVVARLWEES